MKTKKRKNQIDLTLRNLRALKKRVAKLERQMKELIGMHSDSPLMQALIKADWGKIK